MEAATVIRAETELTALENPATSAAFRAEDQLAVVKMLATSKIQRPDSCSLSGEEALGVLIRGHPSSRTCMGSWE